MAPSNVSDLISLEAALEVILGAVTEVDAGEEVLALDQCSGRVLARDVISQIQVPPADNSAVDGYVVTSDLCRQSEPRLERVVDRIPAGAKPAPLPPSGVARIFTGATIPAKGAAVVMQEDCRPDRHHVLLPANIQFHQNIRPAGQDIANNALILKKGSVLKAADIGLAASVGLAELSVKPQLKVAIFSTGDELVAPGRPIAEGKIYNSNRYMLSALLRNFCVDVVDCGIVPDNFKATTDALHTAAQADLIISSGGVSVGEEDHVVKALEQEGRLQLWKLAIKPGKPLAFGLVKNTPFLGLPGNPSSVFVTFCLVAIRVIQTLQGQIPKNNQPIRLPAFFDMEKTGRRQEYIRVRLCEKQGVVGLEKYPNQSSAVLTSVSWADGFAVVAIGQKVAFGDPVEYLSFDVFGV